MQGYSDLILALFRFGGSAMMLFSVILAVGIVLYYRAEYRRLRYRSRLRDDLYFKCVLDLIWPIIVGAIGAALFYYSF